jgi:hypothetical protein
MAVVVVTVSVRKAAAPGTSITITFADGSGREFGSIADVQAMVDQMGSAVDVAQNFAIARMVALSPDLSNTSQVLGKNCTLDFNSVNVFRVQ